MIIYYLGLLGVAVFAVSGGLAAGRKGLDWVGVVSLGVVTSLGGGTLRDVFLNRSFIFWIAEPSYLWAACGASCFTILYFRFFKPPVNALLIVDALGLALFTIVGAQIAEAEGASFPVIVVMAILTGVAGGVIRDILMNEIPLLFRSTETLYSVAALAGTLLYLALQELSIDRSVASLCGIALVAVLRFAAIFWKIRLPAFHVGTD